MYVITGATGNTGKVAAEKLLSAGKKVRVLGRSAERLSPLKKQGAEIFVGDLSDEAFLETAFAGADAIYVMIPPNYGVPDFRAYQDDLGGKIVNVLRKTSPKYVVHLSSHGAEVPEGTGPIAGLHRQEKRLNALEKTNVLHLRPAYFMENLLANVPLIKNMGVNGTAIKGDLSFGMIATQDVGAYAAGRLLSLDFSGKSHQDLLGERNLTMVEVTAALGRAIGKPDLKYIQFSYEDALKGMTDAGLTENLAGLYVEMMGAFNEGVVKAGPRNAENTTPTSIEDFANIFAQVYNS